MARPKPRIDLLKHVGKPIKFSADDRLAVEAKYGHKLTSEQWEQITDVTSTLTLFVRGIKRATRSRVVLSKLKRLEAAARSLRSEFNEISDYGTFTPQEIYWGFFSQWRCAAPRQTEDFEFFAAILGAAIKFSEFAIQQLRTSDSKQAEPGVWIGCSGSFSSPAEGSHASRNSARSSGSALCYFESEPQSARVYQAQ